MNIGFVGLLRIVWYQYLENGNSSEPDILLTHVRAVLISFLGYFSCPSNFLSLSQVGTDIRQIGQYKKIIFLHSLSLSRSLFWGLLQETPVPLGWFGLPRPLSQIPSP